MLPAHAASIRVCYVYHEFSPQGIITKRKYLNTGTIVCKPHQQNPLRGRRGTGSCRTKPFSSRV